MKTNKANSKDGKVTPVNCSHLSKDGERFIDTVRRVAGEYRVSERTARRYLKRGELPPALNPTKPDAKWWEYTRHRGRDGKWYPSSYKSSGRPRTPLKNDLTASLQALRRVEKKGPVCGFYPEDMADLKSIYREARELLTLWMEAEKGQVTTSNKLTHKTESDSKERGVT